MQYKTMILELLKQRPKVHERLRSQRLLLWAINRYATQLKSLHDTWKEELALERPDSDPMQLSSEAMELALHDLIDSLPIDSPTTEGDTEPSPQEMAPIDNLSPRA